jgi:hypothetical protein
MSPSSGVVLYRPRRRLLRFAVVPVGKLALLAGSAHDAPLDRLNRFAPDRRSFLRIDLNLTAFGGYINRSWTNFLPFSDVRCKGRRNPSMIRTRGAV